MRLKSRSPFPKIDQEQAKKLGRHDPRRDFSKLDDDVLLDQREVAAALGLSFWTVQTWRARRTGPAYIRLGAKAARYRVGDLRAWIAQQQVHV